MEPTLDPNRASDAAAAAAAAVTDDPETAQLLQRHAAKEKLTPQEYGKIGAFAKAKQFIFGKGSAAPGSAQPGPQTRNPAGVGPVPSGETQDSSLAPVTVDDGLAQRTTAALLRRADAFCVSYIDREAKAAGATGEIIDRIHTAAGLHRDDQKLLVELSPDVCRELGIDPSKYALFTALGVVGLHGLNLWQSIQELRELKQQARPAALPASPTSPSAPAPTSAAPAAAPAPEAPLTAAAAGLSVFAAPPGAVAPANLPKRGVGPIANLQEGAKPTAKAPAQVTKSKTKK
jgi:hypothetical protein